MSESFTPTPAYTPTVATVQAPGPGQLQLAIDTIPGLVWSALPDGHVDFLNQRWLEYTGLSPEEAIGWGWRSAVCPDDLPRLLAYWLSVLESGKPGEIEARLRRHDGVDRWFLFRGVPLYDDQGKVVKWYGQITDIEDRKRAEEEAKKQTAHLDELFELAPHAVVLVDADIRLIRVNREFTNIFGYSPEESVGRLLQDLVVPEERMEEYQNNKRLLSSGSKVEMETIRRRKDGTRITVSMTASPVLTAGPIEGYIIYRDITDRKRHEEELNKQTAHLDELFEVAPHAVALVDDEVRVIRVNKEFTSMFGYTSEEAEGRLLQDLVAPEERMAEYQNNARLLSSGSKVEMETIRRRKDGVRLAVSMTASPVLTAGPIEGYIIYRDITARKRDEALLSGEKRLLEMIATGEPLLRTLEVLCRLVEQDSSGSMCSILFVDKDGKRLRPAVGPSLPLSYISILDGWPVGPDTGPCARAAFLRETVIVSDFQAAEVPGSVRTLAATYGFGACWSVPIMSRDQRVLGTFAVYYREPRSPSPAESNVIEQFRHLASIAIERTQTEDAIRRNEALLAEAQRLTRTGSFSWRVSTGEITWSDEIYRIYQVDPAITPTLDLVRPRIYPSDLPLFEQAVRGAAADPRDIEVDHRLQFPDGSVKHLHVVAHVTSAPDEPLEYVGTVMDVTDRKRSEDALERARLELAHVSRVTTLGQMAASIAHEINQPLAGIVINANAGLRWLAADPPNLQGASDAARRTLRDGQRAGDVIARLRSLFQRTGPRKEQLQINDVVREVLALARVEVQNAGVVLRTEMSEELPAVVGDRVQVQQLLLNLILNAIEAMSDVRDRLRELVLRTSLGETGEVQISVRDSGIGLEPGKLEQIFDPFYSTKSDGMGMGLAISRSIAEDHGGRLAASANDGPGATFAFALPGQA